MYFMTLIQKFNDPGSEGNVRCKSELFVCFPDNLYLRLKTFIFIMKNRFQDDDVFTLCLYTAKDSLLPL